MVVEVTVEVMVAGVRVEGVFLEVQVSAVPVLH